MILLQWEKVGAETYRANYDAYTLIVNWRRQPVYWAVTLGTVIVVTSDRSPWPPTNVIAIARERCGKALVALLC